MGEIINVRKIVEDKKQELISRVKKLKQNNIIPKLAVILANNEDSSKIYVGNKRKLCSEIGIEEVEYIFDENISNEEMMDTIERLNIDDSVTGILVQLPIFKHLDKDKILDSIDPNKDVDGFHPLNLGKLLCGKAGIISCTPKGIMTILDSLGEEIQGKNAVVLGRSIIVGKPISQLLLNRGATVTTCHSKTINLKSFTKNADVLVVAVGKPRLVTEDMVKENAIVIDVGINRVNDKVVGDVDTEKVIDTAKYITSVPGGVGLTTVLSLIQNIVEMAEK